MGDQYLKHGCVQERRWWLVQLHGSHEHRKSAYLYEFLSPAFAAEQAVERLRLALLSEMEREPNARTKTLLACFEADCDPPTAIELDYDNCYPVSYFNNSRSYNSAGADRYLGKTQ